MFWINRLWINWYCINSSAKSIGIKTIVILINWYLVNWSLIQFVFGSSCYFKSLMIESNGFWIDVKDQSAFDSIDMINWSLNQLVFELVVTSILWSLNQNLFLINWYMYKLLSKINCHLNQLVFGKLVFESVCIWWIGIWISWSLKRCKFNFSMLKLSGF